MYGRTRLFEAFGKVLAHQGLVGKRKDRGDTPRQRNTREQNKKIKEGKQPLDLKRPHPWVIKKTLKRAG